MVIAHIYVGDKLHRLALAHAPRVGDTLRMLDGSYVEVTGVVWALDECTSGTSRVNIRTEDAPPSPVAVTAAMVKAFRDTADCTLAAAKTALVECNGDADAALLWLINQRNG